MNWIVTRIKWIMLVSGALTCTMIYAAIAPQAALRSTFGETLEGPLAEIIVRNWAVLITAVPRPPGEREPRGRCGRRGIVHWLLHRRRSSSCRGLTE